MAVAEELVAILGFRLSNEADLKKWKKSLDEGEQKAKGVGGHLATLGRAGVVAGVAMAGMAAKGVKEFADFERSMTRIGVTAGASVQETVSAGKAVQDLANRFAMPLDQAREGLDTLVSSGMNLDQALAFLPSVLMSAQASGAATADMANTAQKTASALGLTAGQMQKAFDIMVTGGKAGQFELKDMATYIPSLASEFSTLGYKGEDGLKRLIAMLQTLRTRTGTAGEAATQASNIFGKMYSEETAKRFKKFGVNLRAEMKAAEKAGKDALTAFVELTEKALKGDMTKLPLLFQDAEFRKGITALLSAKDAWKGFYDTVNSNQVDGSTLSDFNRVAGDTEASIQRMSNSWDTMWKKIGEAAAPAATFGMDKISSAVDRQEKAAQIRKNRGDGWFGQSFGWMVESPDDLIRAEDEKTKSASDRRRNSMLNRPSRRGGRIQSDDPNARASGAFSAFPDASAKPAAGSMDAAVDQLRGAMGGTKIGVDVSGAIPQLNAVQRFLRDISAGANARLTVDGSQAMAEIERVKAAMRDVGQMRIGSGASTPARVGGAGAAP